MLNCSYWAKSHPKAAILIIALSKITIGLIALFLGITTCFEGWVLEPALWRNILVVIAASLIILYPQKSLKAKWGIVRYHRFQKRIDACLVAFGFAFWFFVGNGLPSWVNQPTAFSAVAKPIPTALSLVGTPAPAAQKQALEHRGIFQKWLIKKAKFKIKRVVEKITRLDTKGLETGMKVVLTLLILILMVGLSYWAIYLGCSLGCSGQETLGTIVMIGGPILIFVLGAMLITKLWKKKQGRAAPVDQSDPKTL